MRENRSSDDRSEEDDEVGAATRKINPTESACPLCHVILEVTATIANIDPHREDPYEQNRKTRMSSPGSTMISSLIHTFVHTEP